MTTIRVVSWERRDSEAPRIVFERDNCGYVSRRMPNANLRDVLEQAMFELVSLGVYKVELYEVTPKQQTLKLEVK